MTQATKPKAARFTREAPDVRRRQLVEAATRCLAKGGIAAFTVDRICKEAGISRGLINHYFPSKDDLLIAVYESSLYETVTGHIAKLNEPPRNARPEDRLGMVVEATVHPSYFAEPRLLVWLALWGEVAVNRKLQAAHRALYDAYRATLAREIEAVAKARGREVDAPALARSFIALFDGLWLEWCLDSRVVSPEDARIACYDLLEAKLGPLPKAAHADP